MGSRRDRDPGLGCLPTRVTTTEFFSVSPGAREMPRVVEKYRDFVDTPKRWHGASWGSWIRIAWSSFSRKSQP
jgi:hypothetical protein